MHGCTNAWLHSKKWKRVLALPLSLFHTRWAYSVLSVVSHLSQFKLWIVLIFKNQFEWYEYWYEYWYKISTCTREILLLIFPCIYCNWKLTSDDKNNCLSIQASKHKLASLVCLTGISGDQYPAFWSLIFIFGKGYNQLCIRNNCAFGFQQNYILVP